MGNYRPDNLSHSKNHGVLFEHIFGPIKENKVIGNSQPRFTEDKSCLANLITFYDKMTTRVDEERAIGIIDFDKAFNIISHVILVRSLQSGRMD